MKHFVPEKEAYRRLGLRERNSRLQPADNREPPHGTVIQAPTRPARLHTRIKRQRQPHIPGLSRNEFGEVWFSYADDCYGEAVEIDRLAYNRTIATELALPITIIEHSGGFGAWNIVGRLKHSSQCGTDA